MIPAPPSDEEFAAALDGIGGFEARPFVAVAVSGGPDSMALALLADHWARRRGGQAYGLTVDHGLRRDSGEEAQTIAGWLGIRGMPHEMLAWAGDKPKTGVQAAAREARYRLLAGWCRVHGCLHLLTAHHREDQAETYLIRRRAKSGVDGLAGMPAVRELDGCRLVRPLLGLPRARLAALLAAERQPFLRDPSNANPVFERVRLRMDTELADPQAIDAAVGAARACGHLRVKRERQLYDALARNAALHPAGFAVFDPAALGALDAELVETALTRVTAIIGGSRYPPRRARLARLRAGLIESPERARTFGGCRLVPWRGRLLVLRELRGAEAPVRLEPGERRLWDRRFAASLPSTADRGFSLGYLGQCTADLPGRRNAAGEGDLPRLIYPVLPAVWDQDGLAGVPSLGYRRALDLALPLLSFRPANPLTTAGFTVV